MKIIHNATLLRFFARMPETLQLETIEKSLSYSYVLKEHTLNSLNRSERFYDALIHTLRESYQLLLIGRAKKHTDELLSLQKQSDLQAKLLTSTLKRKAKKRSKVLHQYAAMIYHFHEEEHKSFFWIAKYLSKYKKLKIDATYLSKLYPHVLETVALLKAEQELEKNKREKSPL